MSELESGADKSAFKAEEKIGISQEEAESLRAGAAEEELPISKYLTDSENPIHKLDPADKQEVTELIEWYQAELSREDLTAQDVRNLLEDAHTQGLFYYDKDGHTRSMVDKNNKPYAGIKEFTQEARKREDLLLEASGSSRSAETWQERQGQEEKAEAQANEDAKSENPVEVVAVTENASEMPAKESGQGLFSEAEKLAMRQQAESDGQKAAEEKAQMEQAAREKLDQHFAEPAKAEKAAEPATSKSEEPVVDTDRLKHIRQQYAESTYKGNLQASAESSYADNIEAGQKIDQERDAARIESVARAEDMAYAEKPHQEQHIADRNNNERRAEASKRLEAMGMKDASSLVEQINSTALEDARAAGEAANQNYQLNLAIKINQLLSEEIGNSPTKVVLSGEDQKYRLDLLKAVGANIDPIRTQTRRTPDGGKIYERIFASPGDKNMAIIERLDAKTGLPLEVIGMNGLSAFKEKYPDTKWSGKIRKKLGLSYNLIKPTAELQMALEKQASGDDARIQAEYLRLAGGDQVKADQLSSQKVDGYGREGIESFIMRRDGVDYDAFKQRKQEMRKARVKNSLWNLIFRVK